MRRAGLIDDVALLREVNGGLRRLWRNPCAAASAADLRRDAWKNPDAFDVPLLRGECVALALDEEIRRASGGTKSLDDFFLELLAEARSGGLQNADRTLSRVERWTSATFAASIRRTVVDGALPPLRASLTEPRAERADAPDSDSRPSATDVPAYRLATSR